MQISLYTAYAAIQGVTKSFQRGKLTWTSSEEWEAWTDSALEGSFTTLNNLIVLAFKGFWKRILVIFFFYKKIAKLQDNNKCQHKIQTISMFKLKITVHVSTLKNSVVKLFVATSVQQECCETEARRVSQNEWRRFTGSYRLPSKSVCFPPESRELNRESSVSAQLCLCGILSKGPCSTDGHCLASECIEGYSQSVSVPSFELNSAPSKHFLNTHPSFYGSF